jgi:hypothetical protein
MVGLITLCIGLSTSLASAQDQSWEQFQNEDTLEVLTIDSEGDEHWSTFWLVVIDGQFYLRLGSRGAGRIEGHTKMPHVSVKIGGQQFDQVKVVDAPDKAEAVAAVMADKYWSDLYIRYFAHPMTVRLEPSE